MRNLILIISSCLFVLLCVQGTQAQLTTANITGTASDPSGAVVPGATVTAKNAETGLSRSTVTNSAGRYELSNLPIGPYEVSTEMSGFKKIVRSGIELTVGRTALVDLAMEVGEVTQSVTVTGEAPLVETSSATVTALVDERKVADLPLNNRDLTQLVFLQPGVIQVPRELGNIGYRSGMGQTFSVAGARGNQNTYLLDGMSNSDLSGNAAGAAQSYIGAETVKEFQIITNNYSAEYQSLPGAIVSAVTKSGTNDFNGSVFEYIRNDNLDAAKWDNKIVPRTDGKAPKNSFARNQYGGALGGPILKDRTFFFGSFEGLRERQKESDSAFVPTIAARQGIIPITPTLGATTTAANCTSSGGVVDNAAGTCTLPVAPSVRPYLGLYPVPGVGNTAGQSANGRVEIFGTQRAPVDDDYIVAKIDHQISSGKGGFLSGTFNFDDAQRDIVRLFDELSGRGTLSRKYVASIKHTSVLTSSLVNEFGFGLNRTKIIGEIPADRSTDFSNVAFVPGAKRVGQFTVGELTTYGYSNSEAPIFQRTISFKDGMALSRGNHSWKFGADLSRIHDEDRSCPPGCYGNYEFRDLRRLLTGVVRRYDGLLPTAANFPGYFLHQWTFGTYFQDDYKVTPALTLNLGLRYEFVTIPKEKNDNLRIIKSFYDAALVPGQFFESNPTTKSFSPRIGFAFAPGNRKTSIRGGGGIFYDHPMLYETRTNLGEMPPFKTVVRLDSETTPTPTPVILFPNAFTQLQLGGAPVTPNLRSAQWNIDTTYIYRWSMNIQHEIMPNWIVSADYTGSRGLHLWNQYQPNINKWEGYPNQPTGAKFFPAVPQGRINPNFVQIRWQASNGNSYHHGLALSTQRRMSNGLQFQLSYNFQKTIDQGSDVSGGELGTNQRTMYLFDTHLIKALSSQDIRHSFVTNYSYQIPFGRDMSGIAGGLIKGWQLNGIITLTAGYPLSVLDSTTAQQNRIGDSSVLMANLIPNGDQNPTEGTTAGCGTALAGTPAGLTLGGPHPATGTLYYDPCQFEPSTPGFFGNLGRSTLISPGVAVFDFSITKDFPVSESSRLQFRAEMFNFTNRVNLAAPDTTPFDSNGVRDPLAGRIINTKGSPRQIQFGLKYIF